MEYSHGTLETCTQEYRNKNGCKITDRSETEFENADLNNDGKLSLEEVEIYLADAPLPDNLNLEDMFNEFDVNGDGFLDASDFDEPTTL